MSPGRASWRDYAEALLVAVLLATFARTFVVQVFRIPSASMEPGLLAGDHVLVDKMLYAPTAFAWERRLLPVRQVERGEVVVFRYPVEPSRDFIKRCLAVGGDRVELRRKQVFVEGEPLDETAYTEHRDPRTYPDSPFLDDYYRHRDNFGPLIVPPGHVFCLGDNRDRSNDSRFWGPVPRRYLKGRALVVSFSLRPREPANPRPAWWRGPAELARRVRWSRIFEPVR